VHRKGIPRSRRSRRTCSRVSAAGNPRIPLSCNAWALQPLLDLRLRAGEGVGAALATQLLRTGLQLRSDTARPTP